MSNFIHAFVLTNQGMFSPMKTSHLASTSMITVMVVSKRWVEVMLNDRIPSIRFRLHLHNLFVYLMILIALVWEFAAIN